MYSLPVRLLEIPHHPHMLLADFICGANAADEDLLCSVVEHLRASAVHEWDVLLLPNVLENSCAERCLDRRRVDWTLRETSSRCDFLEYAGYEEFLAAVSKNFRGNLRKARNKLAKMEASFLFINDRRQLADAFEQFCRIEASGWKGRQGTGTAIELDVRLKAFYRALIDNFGAKDSCQINLLMASDICLAGQFCLRTNGTLHILKIGYDESHASVAPGNMLLEQLIRRSAFAESRASRINLVTGVQWHDDWKPRSEKVSNVWIYNHNARGAALFGLANCRYRFKGTLKGVLNRVGRVSRIGRAKNRGSEKSKGTWWAKLIAA